MTTYSEFQSSLEKDAINQSISPSLYHMNTIQKRFQGCLSLGAYYSPSKIGGSMVEGANLVDVDSELMGITRIQTKNFQFKHFPNENKEVKYLHLKDGLFHEESTLLSNPPAYLRCMTKNRWENVHLQPQDNVIQAHLKEMVLMPYLNLVDNFKDC